MAVRVNTTTRIPYYPSRGTRVSFHPSARTSDGPDNILVETYESSDNHMEDTARALELLAAAFTKAAKEVRAK